MSDTKVAKRRQMDPDVARIRAVKEAQAKRQAAYRAHVRASDAFKAAEQALSELIQSAPLAQQAYLSSLAPRPAMEDGE